MIRMINKLRREDSEDGVVAVLVALALVVLMGFTAFAIDESSWLVKQREYQNAADAAALTACDKMYRTHYDSAGNKIANSKDEAKKSGFILAQKNGVDVNDTEMTFTFNDAKKSVTVKISKPTENYFSQVLSGKDTTTVTVNSTASISTIEDNSGSSKTLGSAIESRSDITWIGNPSTIHGGVQCEGTFMSNADVTVENGVKANGGINIYNGFVLENGDLTTNGDIMITHHTEFKGDIRADGKFTSCNKSTYNNITAKEISINKDLANGDTVNGTLTYKSANETPYKWNWGWLRTDIEQNISDGRYVEVTKDLVSEYLKIHSSEAEWHGVSMDDNGNLSFNDDKGNPDIKGFLDFCRQKCGKNDGVIYVRGNIQMNTNHPLEFDGSIICGGDCNSQGHVQITGSIVSLNGDLTIGQQKAGTNVGGALVTLANEGTGKGNITLTNGTISQGIIAAGIINMRERFDVTGKSEWIKIVDPPKTVTKEFVRLST